MLAEDPTMQPIRILVTGGTFDKEYNELTGELFFQSTHTGDMLRLGRCLLEVEIETLMMIDSLQMTDAGRRHILERRRTQGQDRGPYRRHGALHLRKFGWIVQPGDSGGIRADPGRGSVRGDERAMLPVGRSA